MCLFYLQHAWLTLVKGLYKIQIIWQSQAPRDQVCSQTLKNEGDGKGGLSAHPPPLGYAPGPNTDPIWSR